MTADNIWKEAITASLSGEHEESRIGGMYETLAFQGFGDPTHPVVWSPARGMSVIYAAAEMLWYLTSREDGEMITHYAPSYKNYLNDGIAMGAYGPRIFSSHAINDVSQELMRGATRRAVIPIFGVRDLRNTREKVKCNDVPCTIALQLLNRDGKLHCITTMRSNDAWKGLPYDVFAFMMIQLILCEATGLEPGAYWHQAGSMHLYDIDEPKLADHYSEAEYSHGKPLELRMNPEIPTLMRTTAILADELMVRRGKLKGIEVRLAQNYGAFSIPCTLLTLASLQNYERLNEDDQIRLSQIIDHRLVDSASDFLNARADRRAN